MAAIKRLFRVFSLNSKSYALMSFPLYQLHSCLNGTEEIITLFNGTSRGWGFDDENSQNIAVCYITHALHVFNI